ncbi:hypothetical protein DOO78_25675 [Roseicella frigidaeris]|uniref:Uncharacterized protein n=1 Tax=Roseicella frigidaeris TaxID=2230885 RepID=A0A327LWR4_9PROT|nr:hypothetical protein DOO78_25675 [Roseicella frigidaeris]
MLPSMLLSFVQVLQTYPNYRTAEVMRTDTGSASVTRLIRHSSEPALAEVSETLFILTMILLMIHRLSHPTCRRLSAT